MLFILELSIYPNREFDFLPDKNPFVEYTSVTVSDLRAVYNEQLDVELKYAASEEDAPTPFTIRAIARRNQLQKADEKVSCVVYNTTSLVSIM